MKNDSLFPIQPKSVNFSESEDNAHFLICVIDLLMRIMMVDPDRVGSEGQRESGKYCTLQAVLYPKVVVFS